MSLRQPSSAPARRAWSTGSLRGPSRPMLEIVLVQPEIPPNAGNVIRLAANTGARLHLVKPLAFTTKARKLYTDVRYAEDDVLVFGAETAGLPNSLLEQFSEEMRLKLPMRAGNRSLNLSNAVAVVVYEAWRQLGFPGGA